MALQDLKDNLAAQAAAAEDSDDDFEIEVIDDRPEGDQREPADLDAMDDDDDVMTDEEIANLGARAEKRIKKLTFKFNEERRQREQAERERTEAVAAGRRMYDESQGHQAEIKKYQKALLERQTTISTGNIETAKGMLAGAMEDGDSEKIAEAQSVLTKAQIASDNVERTQKSFDAQAADPTPAARPTVQDIAERRPTPEAAAWTKKNTWFGENRRMTSFAYGVHEELVLEGMQPDTPKYYEAIDTAMRETFPAAFAGSGGTDDDPQGGGTEVDISPTTPRRTPVAKTGRTSGSDRRPGKVRLTRTQVATAKQLGVPLKEYARQVLKMEAN